MLRIKYIVESGNYSEVVFDNTNNFDEIASFIKSVFSMIIEVTVGTTTTKNSINFYNTKLTDKQYLFLDYFGEDAIQRIYIQNSSKSERLHEYMILFGFEPDVASFQAFFAAVNFYHNESNINSLVQKLANKNWIGKPDNSGKTAISLMLVHQYRQIDVIKNNICDIDILSLVKLLKLLSNERVVL